MSYGWNHSHLKQAPYGFTALSKSKRVRVFLGDIEFPTCFIAPPKKGSIFIATDLEGWWESAEVDTDTFRAPSGDGALAFQDRLGPRSVVLSLMAWAAPGCLAELDQWVEKISRMRRTVLRIVEPDAGLDRESDVRLLSVRTTRRDADQLEVTLSLQADDPLRYGTAAQPLANGRNVLVNPGDAVAFPVLDLVGPHSALTITHPGGTFAFPALSSGQRRSIDGRNGDVWNGQSRVFVGAGPWPRVDIGGAEWTIAGLGNGAATARRFQAWT